jgi:hypothetical protein
VPLLGFEPRILHTVAYSLYQLVVGGFICSDYHTAAIFRVNGILVTLHGVLCCIQIVQCINLLNAELNPICHQLALLGAHPILHVSRIRVK